MSVHQLPDGRWIVKYAARTNPDKPAATREYFGRGFEAQEAAIRRNAELGMGKSISTGPTFRDLATAYVDARSGSIARSTMADLGWKLDGIIYPALGDLPGSAIKPPLLDHFVMDRKQKGLKMTSIHRELSIIRAIIRWAVSRQLLVANPMDGYSMPTRDDAIINPPTEAEVAIIYHNAAPHLQRAIMLGYYTGMRPGGSELLALRWERVDLINRTIFVESAKKGGMRARIVPIAEGLHQLMEQWMAVDRKAGPLGWVVHYHGKVVLRISHAWNRALQRSGITRRIRPYDLRHMAATSMLEAGADLKSVSEILGHADPSMTLRTYQHTSTARRRDAIDRIGNPLQKVNKNNEQK